MTICAERFAGESKLLGRLLLAVDRAEKRAAFKGKDGLGVFRVAELASP